MEKFAVTVLTIAVVTFGQYAVAGPLDPDCTTEKAAKSATAKATIGVGGRCSPAEAAKDTAKNAVGEDDDHNKDKRHHDDHDDNNDD